MCGDGVYLVRRQGIARTNRPDSTPEDPEDCLGQMGNAKGGYT